MSLMVPEKVSYVSASRPFPFLLRQERAWGRGRTVGVKPPAWHVTGGLYSLCPVPFLEQPFPPLALLCKVPRVASIRKIVRLKRGRLLWKRKVN